MDGLSCSAGRGTNVSAAVGSSPEKSQPPWQSWRDVVVLSEEGRAAQGDKRKRSLLSSTLGDCFGAKRAGFLKAH